MQRGYVVETHRVGHRASRIDLQGRSCIALRDRTAARRIGVVEPQRALLQEGSSIVVIAGVSENERVAAGLDDARVGHPGAGDPRVDQDIAAARIDGQLLPSFPEPDGVRGGDGGCVAVAVAQHAAGRGCYQIAPAVGIHGPPSQVHGAPIAHEEVQPGASRAAIEVDQAVGAIGRKMPAVAAAEHAAGVDVDRTPGGNDKGTSHRHGSTVQIQRAGGRTVATDGQVLRG